MSEKIYNEYESTQLIRKCENEYLIGRLRNNNPVNEMPNSSYNSIRIFISPLCDNPKCVNEIESLSELNSDYIAIDTHQTRDVLPYGYNSKDYYFNDRIRQLEDYYYDTLIIFNPYFKMSNNGNIYKNAIIVKTKNDISHDDWFELVPSLKEETGAFEKTLKSGDFFDLNEYDAELHDSPRMILCGKYLYRKRNNDLLKDHTDFLEASEKSSTRWKTVNPEDIVRIDISQYERKIVRINENLVFIEDTVFNDILQSEDYEQIKDWNIVNAIPKEEEADESRELTFLKALQKQTVKSGLRYDFNDLVNFHTSVKTNPLTILAGLSGTGKTQLALNYAKMLNLSEDNGTLLFMPISPSYTEPSDILGFLNSMNHQYVPAETGLVRFLQHASLNMNQLHLVIFDEMNLSQVEYWFSPFISILEKDPNDRYLTLYAPDTQCDNAESYPYQIKINENVLFVGTVNMDETTKEFSDRLLDRTFVLHLEKMKFEDFYHAFQSDTLENVDINTSRCNSVMEYRSWCNTGSYLEVFHGHTEELRFLDAIDEVMKKYIPNGGISYRMLKNIANYLLNVPRSQGKMLIERSDAFDMIINQTIMTKIRGTESQLETLVGHLNDADELEDSLIKNVIEEYHSISSFTKVLETLKKKAKELIINGYAD